MKQTLIDLKESNQDFEFYPTTTEIIAAVYHDINRRTKQNYLSRDYDLLEIGAGNGKVFKVIKGLEQREAESSYRAKLSGKFAIEKSEILINQLPADIAILGTDFWLQNLMDKKVDIIFSNPPYSQFEDWSAKIISEAFASEIYLVIPERWKTSETILRALKNRSAQFCEVIGNFDFLQADRVARSKVDLVRIKFKKEILSN